MENNQRLDAYERGQSIVSRKATDFDQIKEETLRGYLQELKNKYPSGTIIRSNKYPELDGEPLTGQLILEVAESNQSAANRQKFENIVQPEGIVIRYTPE